MRCPNCGFETSGNYCADCGQKNVDFQRSFLPVLMEVLRESMDVDAKIWRTLRCLLLQPGELSNEFARNRRARYISPIRLYFFTSLMFFFLLALSTDIQIDLVPIDGVAIEEGRVGAVDDVDDADLIALAALLDAPQRARLAELMQPDKRPDEESGESVAQRFLREISADLAENPPSVEGFEAFLFGLAVDVLYEPQETMRRLVDNLPVAMFLMLPLYAILLALIYAGSKRYFVAHLVFAAHLHAFAFIVFTVLLLLPEQSTLAPVRAIVGIVSTLLSIALFTYYFIALKRFYGESLLVTLGKFIFLLLLQLMWLVPGALMVVVITVLAA